MEVASNILQPVRCSQGRVDFWFPVENGRGRGRQGKLPQNFDVRYEFDIRGKIWRPRVNLRTSDELLKAKSFLSKLQVGSLVCAKCRLGGLNRHLQSLSTFLPIRVRAEKQKLQQLLRSCFWGFRDQETLDPPLALCGRVQKPHLPQSRRPPDDGKQGRPGQAAARSDYAADVRVLREASWRRLLQIFAVFVGPFLSQVELFRRRDQPDSGANWPPRRQRMQHLSYHSFSSSRS